MTKLDKFIKGGVLFVNCSSLKPLEQVQNHVKKIEDVIGEVHGEFMYYVLHCLATKIDQEVHKEDIILWHMGPSPNRGWSRPGYIKLLLPDGSWEEIYAHDYDENIEGIEMTWGAKGFNKNCLHVGINGGLAEDGSYADTLTDEQYKALKKDVLFIAGNCPWVKIVGHCQLNPTGKPFCPGWDVPRRLRDMGVPEKNIVNGNVS